MSDKIKGAVDSAAETAKQFVSPPIHASDAKVADRPFSDREQEGAAALGGEGKQATSESGNKAGESKNTTGSKTDETTASAKETAQMAKDTIAEHGTDTGHTTGGGAGHKS